MFFTEQITVVIIIRDSPPGEENEGAFHIIFKYFIVTLLIVMRGAKGDWNFQISDLVKNPDGNYI